MNSIPTSFLLPFEVGVLLCEKVELNQDFAMPFGEVLKLLVPNFVLFHDAQVHLGLLQRYVQSLIDEGILNDQFAYIQAQKTIDKPDHVVQLVNVYCTDVDAILLELARYVDLPDGDFTRLTALTKQIEERSSHIGVENMRLVCAQVIEDFHDMKKSNCLRDLSWLKTEFSRTQNKLQVIVQMERKIMRLEGRQRN